MYHSCAPLVRMIKFAHLEYDIISTSDGVVYQSALKTGLNATPTKNNHAIVALSVSTASVPNALHIE